jgi:hypothetical protein
VLPAGAVRFWFDAWADNPQPDGGSQQGMLNQILPTPLWQIFMGDKADLAVLWLQAMGTSAIEVADKRSVEPYQNYSHPEKFQGALPVLYDDAHGTRIYRVPRTFPGIARVVDQARIGGIGDLARGDNPAGLAKYVSAIEDPVRPEAVVAWHGFDEVDINASVKQSETVLLQETWDPAWRADENGRSLPVRLEPVMGFMLIDVPEGVHKIRMRFETPLENRIGQIFFVVTVLLLAALVFLKRPFMPAPNPKT